MTRIILGIAVGMFFSCGAAFPDRGEAAENAVSGDRGLEILVSAEKDAARWMTGFTQAERRRWAQYNLVLARAVLCEARGIALGACLSEKDCANDGEAIALFRALRKCESANVGMKLCSDLRESLIRCEYVGIPADRCLPGLEGRKLEVIVQVIRRCQDRGLGVRKCF